MNFEWSDKEQDMALCQKMFNDLGTKEALFLSHYELAEKTKLSPELWKKFITHPKVSDWLTIELDLFKQHELRKMIKNANSNDRSVGAAQMINALSKLDTGADTKEGPVYIYTYVPLNDEEQNAPNVVKLDRDIFRRDD